MYKRQIQGAPQAGEQELRELFGKVERRLREIDKLLSDASAGETKKLDQVGASGIDEILKNASARHQEVLEGIDRILEIARELENQQQSSASQGGQPKPGEGGESPLDKRGGQSTQREETPSKPEGQGSQPKPKPGGEKPENSKQPGGQDTPKDGRASPDHDPKNTPGAPQGPQPTERTQRPADEQERWGDLPVHARDVFRTEGGGDMPVQYRDWIDAYYKRLNKKP